MDKTPQQGDLVERGGEWHFISWIDNGEPISASDGCTCVGARLILPACDSMAEAWEALKAVSEGDEWRRWITMDVPTPACAGNVITFYRRTDGEDRTHIEAGTSATCLVPEHLAGCTSALQRLGAFYDYLANVRAKEQK